MKIHGIRFDVMERHQRLLCYIDVTPTWYSQWETTLKICGTYKKGTELNTSLLNQCHMGIFCMRFEIGRWGF